jgi:GNAT superfamily N-acetyltransferase
MKRGKKPLWLIRKGKRLIGGVDAFEPPSRFDGKRRGGCGLNLTREAQGKGFARAIYETMLLELRNRGIERYFGYTAQPGVMRLGKIMGRTLWGLEVDREFSKVFSSKHFKAWV